MGISILYMNIFNFCRLTFLPLTKNTKLTGTAMLWWAAVCCVSLSACSSSAFLFLVQTVRLQCFDGAKQTQSMNLKSTPEDVTLCHSASWCCLVSVKTEWWFIIIYIYTLPSFKSLWLLWSLTADQNINWRGPEEHQTRSTSWPHMYWSFSRKLVKTVT